MDFSMSIKDAQSPCFLGLDLGTSSCKARIIDVSGQSVSIAHSAYPTHRPQNGWAEQNPSDWWEAVVSCLAQLREHLPAIQSMALTSAAHIAVLLDAQDRVLRPAILWNDQRAAQEADEFNQQAGALILEQTCQRASPGWSLAQLAWIAKYEPQTWAKVRHILLSKDYLAWRLTGEKITDPATAVSSQLYDTLKNNWSNELCQRIDLDPHALPTIKPTRHIVGQITAQAATELGLPAGISVINGSLDSATELLAAGCITPGQSVIRLATAGGLQMVLPHRTPHNRRITYPHLIEPYWYTQAGTNTCAAAIQWAMNLIDPQMTFEDAQNLARQSDPGANGVLFHPYLAGERAPYWNPNLRATFSHLASSHTRADLMRSVYEGTAMSIRDAACVLEDPFNGDQPIAVIGGGAKCRLWVQILASVINQQLRCLTDCDSASGAAQLAMSTTTRQSITRLPTPPDTEVLIQPNVTWIDGYQQLFEQYQNLARQMSQSSML
jgi:xylulokinase